MTLRDGSEVKGKILSSDADKVWVERRDVKRADIADVWHPGKELMVGGVVLAGVGGFLLTKVEHWEGCCGSGRDHYYEADTPVIATGFTLIGGGVIAGIAGAVTYFTSKSRYAPPERAAAAVPIRSRRGHQAWEF